jgi:glutamate--cysteine ligase
LKCAARWRALGKICALPALWVGLLYDQTALGAAWDEVKHWSLEERQRLRDDVPKLGLDAITPAAKAVAARVAPADIAEAGLKALGAVQLRRETMKAAS